MELDFWDVLSQIASVISVLSAVVAIFVAIYIPKKIANQQNNITLFDKRFEFYDVLHKCVVFSQMIQNSQALKERQTLFVTSFSRMFTQDTTAEDLKRDYVRLSWQATMVLRQGSFLFDFETEQWIKPLVSSLTTICSAQENHDAFWDSYSKYMTTIKNIEDNFLPKVEQALWLGKRAT